MCRPMRVAAVLISILSLHSWIYHVEPAASDNDSSMDGRTDRFTSGGAALCGNDLCDSLEDVYACPRDCGDLRLTTADVGGAKGAAGFAFSVGSVRRDVVVNSLEVYSRLARSRVSVETPVQVYVRDGHHAGRELDEEGWDLVYDETNVDLRGEFETTSLGGLNVSIPAGSIQSFFVYASDKIRYDRGTGEGGVFFDDGMLQVYEGVGVRNKLSGNYPEDIFSARVFTGSIAYDAVSTEQPGLDTPTPPVVEEQESNSTLWHINWDTPITCRQGSIPSWNRPLHDTAEECCKVGLSYSPALVEECLSSTAMSSTSPATFRFNFPSDRPVASPIKNLTEKPTNQPTSSPSADPSKQPTANPTKNSTERPTNKSADAKIVEKLSFVVMGDIPYTKDQRYCLNKQLRHLNQEEMNFKFMAHVGDLKWGKSPCYESSFSDIAEIFSHPSNAIGYDTRDIMLVPGDNEWPDCQDPDQAWRWWMKHFGNGKQLRQTGISPNENGFGTLSDLNVAVDYQTEPLLPAAATTTRLDYPSSSGNFAFFASQVLFVGINQVGGGTWGDESSRVHNNYEWAKENMAKYSSRGMRAVVVFAHATMTSSRRQYFGNPFMNLLREVYPSTMVLYVHGDGHNFDINQPDDGNPNLHQLEVDGGDEADPLLISIVHDTVEDEFKFNIDVRDGYYYGGCQSDNKDKTWSSDY